MRVLVMGGTRFVGVAAVEALLEQGHEVTVFHRGSRRPRWSAPVGEVLGDRTIRADLVPLVALDVDAVLDLSAYTRAQTALLLDVLPSVPHLVHVSTVNVYRPSPLLPWPEDTPYGPHPLWGQYAVEKIGCEQELRSARPAPLRTVAVRMPLVLGPRNFIPREEFVLNRLLDGATVLLPGDGQAVHQYIHLTHAADALARAVTTTTPGFTAFNVASPRCVTSLEGFVQICAEVAGVPATLLPVGGGPTGLDRPVFDQRDCVFPFTNENTVADLGAARDAGLLPPFLDLREMVDGALRALRADPQRRRWERTAAERLVLDRTPVATP